MDPLSTAWYQRQSRLSLAATAAVGALWSQVDPARISESWAELLPQAVQAVTVGQLAAATQADTYVAAQAQRQGVRPQPSGRVSPQAFAGVAADGGDLGSLLYLPAIDAKVRIAGGAPVGDALLSGGFSLLSYVATETGDAGKLAAQVATTSDRSMRGYRRMLRTPSCSRCIVLAGKFYKWNTGFLRHPRCDCVHIPAAEAGDLSDSSVNPSEAFASMTTAQQDRAFGKANAAAIRDGADVSQVVNARRGMASPGSRTTLEGLTRRGAYGRRNPGRGRAERMTVQAIYDQAGDDRDEAIRLLKQFAFVL